LSQLPRLEAHYSRQIMKKTFVGTSRTIFNI